MPITLVTGDPGAGKTAYVVDWLLALSAAGRPIVQLGIPELKIPHSVPPPLSEWTYLAPLREDNSIQIPTFSFPEGAMIVIDEAHFIFPLRVSTSKLPDIVAALPHHRHTGLDFILLTQHPSQIDVFVRNLVTQHIHIRGNWAGRSLLEWPQAANPKNKSDRDLAVTRKFKLPRKTFLL